MLHPMPAILGYEIEYPENLVQTVETYIARSA